MKFRSDLYISQLNSKPLTMENKNDYIFLHDDGEREIIVKFDDCFTDSILRNFVDFLRACGHYDKSIYGCMQAIVDENETCVKDDQQAEEVDVD